MWQHFLAFLENMNSGTEFENFFVFFFTAHGGFYKFIYTVFTVQFAAPETGLWGGTEVRF